MADQTRLLLGIDTGGTFTDAVLVDEQSRTVVAKAKAPTTHHDLIVGVDAAVGAVLDGAGFDPASIVLVSVSTTLATNALVEGTGEPACLVAIGFSEAELASAGIANALGPDDSLVVVAGGHDAHGTERLPTADVVASVVDALSESAERFSGYAVASQFSVRNPKHELAVKEEIRRSTGASVTCSHLLSAKLGGPRRALTAFLNARLIGMIASLVAAVESSTAARGITAPVMVVRGDGSLVSSDFAAERPIETVLSGPAASVIGAMHLSEEQTALVSDIGGTTTDVAIVTNGRPSRTEQGAVVAGHPTMVEAVDMMTVGLGGDSEVQFDARSAGKVVLGPRRAIPLSRLSEHHHDTVHRFLDRSLHSTTLSSTDMRLLVATGVGAKQRPTDDREAAILDELADGPAPERAVAGNSLKARALDRLRNRGLVRVCTMTPTDAAQVLGIMDADDIVAATKIAELAARQQDGRGASIAQSPETLAAMIVDMLVLKSAEAVLAAALRGDGIDRFDVAADRLATEALNRQRESAGGSDAGPTAMTRIDVGVSAPIIALGASAAAYYPRVGELLGAKVVVPPHADVANAVGAAVGDVVVRAQLTVTQPRKGQFRVHHEEQPTFGSIERAQDHAREILRPAILAAADEAGADAPVVSDTWEETVAMMDDKQVFVEGTMRYEAVGRPRSTHR